MNELKGKYFIKKTQNGEWEDITTKFDGVKVLSIDGFEALGKPVNVFTQQYVNAQEEDFMIATLDENNNPIVIRENVDIAITCIVGSKYSERAIDVRTQHDAFVDCLTSSDVYIKSTYTNKEVRCVCLEDYKPTTEKLKRAFNSYILGTIKIHTLDVPQVPQSIVVNDLYIGFGESMISNTQTIKTLANVQHYNRDDVSGSYSIQCPSLSYLWICTRGTISGAQSLGASASDIPDEYKVFFEIPLTPPLLIEDYRCYRTMSNMFPHTMNFDILTN